MNILEIVLKAKPRELPEEPKSTDHASHVVELALLGYPELAVDSLLNPLLVGRLPSIIGDIVRKLNFIFEKTYWNEKSLSQDKILKRAYAYDVLIEIAINLYGIERDWVGFTDYDTIESLNHIYNTLTRWEELEASEYNKPQIAFAVVKKKIEDMKKVMSGDPKRIGMIAWMGENIEKRLSEENPSVSFLNAIRDEIKNNIYYIMYRKGMCRFGNDYAIGLRWLRHLGYVQVSTNPQLAAIAYRDDPALWEKLREYFRTHKELLKNIDSRKDELAMTATMLALWPNMEVFRPVAYLLDFTDGMVSYQLNPNVANSYEGSVRDAVTIYNSTQEYFEKYDKYLLWGWPSDIERGRPNIVFKVAASSPSAIDITRKLESMGIGTNNTVTYTVSQEVKLILSKLEGMAEAVKKGIKTTKNYETNMGGRLDDHLREVFAARLIKKALENLENKTEKLAELANSLGLNVDAESQVWKGPTGWGWDKEAKTLDEKIQLVASRQYIKKLTNEKFAEFLASQKVHGTTKEEVMKFLEEWEKAIGMSGTLVARRVWWIFFHPENRGKWIAYLISNFNIEPEKAEEILNNIDLLPASKRKPMDTYLTLARNNMTNTEFPNHQLNVLKTSREPGFNLDAYDNAIMKSSEEELVKKLYSLEDFIKAYELTTDLKNILEKVGVDVRNMGTNGLNYEDWGSFGSAVKTMNGFTEAYNVFRDKVVKIAKEVASEVKTE